MRLAKFQPGIGSCGLSAAAYESLYVFAEYNYTCIENLILLENLYM